jgi:hypothetical protein
VKGAHGVLTSTFELSYTVYRRCTSRKNRDQASLAIFWLRDESLEESDNLPDPDALAQEIVEDHEAALEQFREIAADLGSREKEGLWGSA